MSHCTEYTVLHENDLGKVGYCYGCEKFHLKMSGLLSVINDEQLKSIEINLENMQLDLETNQDTEDLDIGVQIKLTKNTYLCLTYSQVIDGLELIRMGHYMKKITDLVILCVYFFHT